MMTNRIERLPTAMAVVIAVLVVTACAIRLRGDDSAPQLAAPADSRSEPKTTKLEQCRTVKYDPKDALLECRKIWAEKRHQFFGQKSGVSTGPDSGPDNAGSASPAPPKDPSRVPSGSPAIPAQGE